MNFILKYTLVITILLYIVPSNANGGTLKRVGTIQFEPQVIGNDSSGGSDIWGWTGPDGTEYAIMGVAAGVAIVNTNLMEVVSIVPGPSTSNTFFSRDIKTYRHYAYVVSVDNGINEGLMVIDLQLLPDTVMFIGSFPIDESGGVKSHNMSIDTSTGFAYIEGEGAGVLSIFDLSDPENPAYVAEFPNSGLSIHDLYARNDTLYLAEGGNQSFSIWDLTDKTTPELLVRKNIQDAGFIHNVWPTDDGKYLLSTEETSGKSVKMWDISDFIADSIKIVDEWLGTSNLAHNVHVMGDFAFVSHYESGVYVLDISDRKNIFAIASYDTYPQGDAAAFKGAFGVYPYTQNGTLFASNIEGRLIVLDFDRTAIGVDIKQPLIFNNYPNPFNLTTTIEFYLPKSSDVNLSVYNINGELIQVLFNEELSAGTYSRIWSGAATASGVYFYRLQTNDVVKTGKMALVK